MCLLEQVPARGMVQLPFVLRYVLSGLTSSMLHVTHTHSGHALAMRFCSYQSAEVFSCLLQPALSSALTIVAAATA
jgi:hypothetical protein